jgi:nicotinate (nicotinamide) nucleotide adenylyltransferase
MVGILPGTFHPPTRAHVALARAALDVVERVVFVLPRTLPHKAYESVGLEERVRMVEAAIAGQERLEVAVTSGGLFIDMARETRARYGGADIAVICGRDAAERIVNWDYGAPDAFRTMIEEFEMLVAARRGEYNAPEEMRGRIRPLKLTESWDDVSATEVRERIKMGREWAHLVPESIVELVAQLYSR